MRVERYGSGTSEPAYALDPGKCFSPERAPGFDVCLRVLPNLPSPLITGHQGQASHVFARAATDADGMSTQVIPN